MKGYLFIYSNIYIYINIRTFVASAKGGAIFVQSILRKLPWVTTDPRCLVNTQLWDLVESAYILYTSIAADGKTGPQQIKGAKVKLRICHLPSGNHEHSFVVAASKIESI